MSDIKKALGFTLTNSADLIIGNTIGKVIDSWFPAGLDYDPDNRDQFNLWKDMMQVFLQSSVTLYLAIAIREFIMRTDYSELDPSSGQAMIICLYQGQPNLWRKINNIYYYLANK